MQFVFSFDMFHPFSRSIISSLHSFVETLILTVQFYSVVLLAVIVGRFAIVSKYWHTSLVHNSLIYTHLSIDLVKVVLFF
jgi:hypothetical protein